MDKSLRGSSEIGSRHELDGLPPTSAITVRLASAGQLPALTAIARTEIPGVRLSEQGLAQFLQFDPESIFTFERSGELLGGIAFLHLNCRGHDALLLDAIDLKAPSPEFLARPDEEVSAMYVWALAGRGRAALGLGNVNQYLKKPRFIAADYFAQPSTPAGRDLLVAIGFRQVPSFQLDLWCYQRPWNKLPPNMPAVIPSRSFADARH
jgi:hypothetical protein